MDDQSGTMAEDYIPPEEVEGQYFDCSEDISSIADACPSSPLKDSFSMENPFINCMSESCINAWTKVLPASRRERRRMLMKALGVVDTMSSPKQEPEALQMPGEELKVNGDVQPDFDGVMPACGAAPSRDDFSISCCAGEYTSTSCDEGSEESCTSRIKDLDDGTVAVDRVMPACGAPPRTFCTRNNCLISCCDGEYTSTSCDESSEESCTSRIKDLDDDTVVVMGDELRKDGLRMVREVGPKQILTIRELEKGLGSSPPRRQDDVSSTPNKKSARRLRWLRKLGLAAQTLHWLAEGNSDASSCQGGIARAEKIKVNSYKKQSKELSAVHKEQGFKAHDGAILTMKFSTDGQHLATGGEDGVVRVWHVMECRRTNEMDILRDDPSCTYFSVNDSSELTPLRVDKEKKLRFRNIGKTSGSVCVVIPPDSFQLSEEPLHEFRGHDGDVLDVSWSSNLCLLSSSMDKTVRMWQVGSDACLRVFPHTDYVTCVQFSPIDEDYFISGCIDGKLRVWKIPDCHVVDWIDTREIVTAVSYYYDGKGVVAGTMASNCRFYSTSDDGLQLDAKVSLKGKKKFPFSRITGFQFCPGHPHKLMVSSADSQVRILDGVGVISTFKGIGNSGSQTPASFTADGQHIISASEDSSVYLWSADPTPTPKYVKSNWPSERFISSNASIAIPWSGLQSRASPCATPEVFHLKKNELSQEKDGVGSYASHCPAEDSLGDAVSYFSPSGCFFLSQELLAFLPKSPATWPEDKLPCSFAASPLSNSRYKLLKTSCQNNSHSWGQVIVTAGLDGWIRSYQNYGLPQKL